MTHRTLPSLVLAAALLGWLWRSVGRRDARSRARILHKQDHKSALVQLKSLLQRDPKQAEARYLLGRVLLEQGDAASAAVELPKAAEHAGLGVGQ